MQLLHFWRDPQHVRFYHSDLISALLRHYGFEIVELLLGNGSDELIQILALAIRIHLNDTPTVQRICFEISRFAIIVPGEKMTVGIADWLADGTRLGIQE